MYRLFARLSFAFSALVLAALAVGYWVVEQYKAPGPLVEDTTVIIPKGAGLSAIAERLADQGVIGNSWVLRLGARLDGVTTELRAGEYAFPASISPREVIEILREGKTIVRRLTIPEGLTTQQILKLIEEAEGLSGSIGAHPKEGALLPDTYHYSFGDDRNDLVGRMSSAMEKTIAELWSKRSSDLPLKTPEQALVLASIVEKESAVPEERPRIAAVFLNRLEKGMPLQADPTVIYALTEGEGPLDRPLSRSDLSSSSPYNTYLVGGLPPGPIANPGRASLAAVMNPARTEDLYFVADGQGGHAFARTIEEHNRNVARWREIESSGGKNHTYSSTVPLAGSVRRKRERQSSRNL